MKKILVTGANRGLGLEFTRQFTENGDFVFAACRHPGDADDLKQLAAERSDRIEIIELDVGDRDSIDKAARELISKTDRLDLLLNNAGIDHHSSGVGSPESHTKLGELEFDSLLHTFRVNSVAPIMVAQALLALIKKADQPRIVNVSSILGSLSNTTYRGYYSYYSSKAALNMMTRILAFDLMDDGIVCVVVHPGWVQTRMGGSGATLTPQQSVSGLIELINGLTLEHSARFWDYKGNEITW